ncbi:hypothetical protein PHLGIDRAFT_399117 [Phlebiopsis gigantea 11061_1 CR5-6]|uniref:Uncharacterized protein n=1 Tax=Phlebiopsis gigantea (strain 11061_1 CR5-6) TaxID=745531 RepID=A0A0C3P2B9_PHLG1|nr:hypothetical protein PHLGIDRAFT_399117 [Phlebiopsis gigantea 11061_1 CR5-6]
MSQQPPALVKHPVVQAQQPTLSQNAATTSGALQFTPRREFLRDHTRVASSFSLLALSGSGFVRLYSFSDTAISTLRRLFAQKDLVDTVREHAPKHFFEFTLEGKPWGNAKSITSEKLIIDILAVIFHCGYSFLSTIDYGREQDDKLAIAFSRPKPPSTYPSNLPLANGSVVSLTQPVSKIPFAISFSSATSLRVVGPPLHSTPAILQAVRGAWPRGVVSEKKVGDATYEFKLKGYKWFQEDTFATDSLHHILGLLTALDGHGFSLLTSLSLSSRSRVKDLWIFLGDFHPESQPSTPSGSRTDLRREVTPQRDVNLAPGPSPLSYGAENRRASRQLPMSVPPSLGNRSPEAVAPALKPHTSPFSKVHNALRKPSPKTGIPVALLDDYLDPSFRGSPTDLSASKQSAGKGSGIRAGFSPGKLIRSLSNPSSVGSVDMTGVGTRRMRRSIDVQCPPDVFYTTDGRPKANGHNPYFPAINPNAEPASLRGHDRSGSHSSKDESRQSLGPSYMLRSSTLPLATRQSVSSFTPGIQVHAPSPISASGSKGSNRLFPEDSSLLGPRAHNEKDKDRIVETARTPTPPLLTPGTFRDSAFSSATGFRSQEIPIAWVGRGPEPPRARRDDRGTSAHDGLHSGAGRAGTMEHRSTGQQPQANTWPRDDKHDVGYRAFPISAATTTAHPQEPMENVARQGTVRTMSPEHTKPHERRSEAAAVGVLDPHTPHHYQSRSSPPPSGASPPPRPPGAARRDTAMSGWVMVNVAPAEERKPKAGSPSPPPTRPGVRQRRSNSDSRLLEGAPKSRSPVGNAPAAATMSAAAKTIAIIDAVEAKEQGNKSPTPSKLQRMFHRTKGADGDAAKAASVRQRTPDGSTTKRRSLDAGTREDRVGVKDKMRATPTNSRPSDKRLSID